MKFLAALLLLVALVLNCGTSSVDALQINSEDSICNVERNAARKGFEKGDFYLPDTRDYRNPSYVEEAFYVLYNVKPKYFWTDVVGNPASCYDLMIDSLVTKKFGKDAFDRAQAYADHLQSTYPNRYGSDCFYSPSYIPNGDSLTADLWKVIHYPEAAKRDSITGVVYVRLEIDSTGSVSKATVVKGVRHDLDSAAVAGALKLGKFHVERRWGIKQAAELNIPIRFSLK